MKTPRSILLVWDAEETPEYARFIAWAWQTMCERGHEACAGWTAEGPFLQCGCEELHVTYLEKLYV